MRGLVGDRGWLLILIIVKTNLGAPGNMGLPVGLKKD
jgi:hypothetical protein